MKNNPLVYVLVIGMVVVSLLVFLVRSPRDPLLPAPDSSAAAPAAPQLAADSDSPSEAVKAVGSQINELRDEQNTFKAEVNQSVENIQQELRAVQKALNTRSQRENIKNSETLKQDTETSIPSTPPPTALPGDEPVAPFRQYVEDILQNAQPSSDWLWIEDQSIATNISKNISVPEADTPSGFLTSESLFGDLSAQLSGNTIAATDNNEKAASLIIPPASMIEGITLTAAIGRLPVRGQLNEPWPVKVVSAMKGYAANGYALDASQMIWDGRAFGDANFECVRVVLSRVTSVLPGRVISFVEAADDERGLAYLSDASGNPCLRGKLITNAAKRLTVEAVLGVAQGVGEAYADTQRTRTVTPDGNTLERVTGEEVPVLLGEGFAQSVSNVRNYLAARHDVWDAIYVAPEQPVVINVDQALEFIYDRQQKLYDVANFTLEINDEIGDAMVGDPGAASDPRLD